MQRSFVYRLRSSELFQRKLFVDCVLCPVSLNFQPYSDILQPVSVSLLPHKETIIVRGASIDHRHEERRGDGDC